MNASFTGGVTIYAKDLALVSTFYEKVAGLAVTQSEPGFVVLESSGFQLVVVQIPPHIAANIHIEPVPVRREDTALKVVLAVESIATARAVAAAMGGTVDGPDREWLFQGARVCDGHDPEGNVIQVRR